MKIFYFSWSVIKELGIFCCSTLKLTNLIAFFATACMSRGRYFSIIVVSTARLISGSCVWMCIFLYQKALFQIQPQKGTFYLGFGRDGFKMSSITKLKIFAGL